MEDQQSVRERGGTMRLGSWPCVLAPDSLAQQAYGVERDPRAAPPPLRVQQRLPQGVSRSNGFVATGMSPDGTLVEIIERLDHPWFLAVQFHPEFKSKPTKAHPLFRDFVAAALKRRRASAIAHESG